MNESEIRRYAVLMNELGLTGIEVNERTGSVRLERASVGIRYPEEAATEVQPEIPCERESVKADGEAKASAQTDRDTTAAQKDNGIHIGSIVSPTVGVFYAAPRENAEPFVKEGDAVKKGDVLCIIETMKLMNELTAEKDGIIEAVTASNGQVVEYGTELFKIRESV